MTTFKKTFQYRLKPTPDQLVQLEQAAGAVRFVYNWGTDLVRKASEKREPIPNYYTLAKNLTKLKQEPDKTWLKEAYNAALQNSLKDLDLSVKAFFREAKKKNRVGLPGFRKKGVNDSLRFSAGIKHRENKFYIPKIGLLGYHDSRPLQGRIKQASVCKIIDKWFINVVCDVPIKLKDAKKHNNNTSTGCTINLGAGFLDKVLAIDANIGKLKSRKKKAKKVAIVESNKVPMSENQAMQKDTRDALRTLCKQYKDVFVSLSDEGQMYKKESPEENKIVSCVTRQVSDQSQKASMPNVENNLPRVLGLPMKLLSTQPNRLLVRRQKKLSRCMKDSNNRSKARVKLEKQHLKIRRRRHDFLHKLSYQLVQQYDCITIKKYELRKIMLSAYTPLAKVLRDKAWDKFIQYLQYKAVWYGKQIIIA